MIEELDAAFGAVWAHLVDADRPPRGAADALFCFGSRDWTVPAHAAALHARGAAPLVVVTGGGPIGDGRREADAFASDLVARGVPVEAIVVERRSRHTGENAEAGMRALAEVAEGVASVIAVSWPLAARRCRATLAKHHPELDVTSAPAIDGTGPWSRTGRTVRAALGELDRLRDYVGLGFVASEPIPAEVQAAADLLRASIAVADPV